MPLESLENDEINIHDLTLEQEKKPVWGAEKTFETLKGSSLYDKVDGEWVSDEKINDRRSFDQLLSVLVEATFGQKETAKDDFQRITERPYCDGRFPLGEAWFVSIADKESDFTSNFLTDIINRKLGKGADLSYYSRPRNIDDLKDSEEFNGERYWNYGKFWTKFLLLETILQSEIDMDKAKDLWAFFNEQLVDAETGFCFIDVLKNSHHKETHLELLYCLAMAKFDKKAAKERYFSLKEKAFFDKEKDLWNNGITTHDSKPINYGRHFSEDQLVGVLCEHEFDEPEPNLQNLQQPTPDLPETRKY